MPPDCSSAKNKYNACAYKTIFVTAPQLKLANRVKGLGAHNHSTNSLCPLCLHTLRKLSESVCAGRLFNKYIRIGLNEWKMLRKKQTLCCCTGGIANFH